MSEVKWIKVSTGMFDSKKMKQIEHKKSGDTILIIWLKLLLIAGIVNDGGAIYLTPDVPYSIEELADELGRPVSIVKTSLDTFEKYGMIFTADDGVIYLVNWEKYQSIDRLTEIREYNRTAKQKSRAKKKMQKEIDDKSMTSQKNVNDKSMTSQRGHETDIDIEIRNKNIDIHTSYVREREQKESQSPHPSLEEIIEFCKERNSPVDPKRFYDFFSATGWKDTNGKEVRAWKSKLISWEKFEKPKKEEEPQQSSFETDEMFYANLRRTFGDEFANSLLEESKKQVEKEWGK